MGSVRDDRVDALTVAHHQVLGQAAGVGVDRSWRSPEIGPHPQPLGRPLVSAEHRPLLVQHHRAQRISLVRGLAVGR
nr:hypothetical protein [Kibdelosporangium sp. MJ126-NF4]